MKQAGALKHIRIAQMTAGRASARNRDAQKQQKRIMQEQARCLNVQGALRAGTEFFVSVRARKRKTFLAPQLQLRSRRRETTGKGKYQSVGPLCRLQMAFGVDQVNSSVGRMFSLGRKAVALNRVAVAECFQTRQLHWLHCLIEKARQEQPLVVLTQRKWDETRQLVSLAAASDKPVRDHVEVMVSSLRLVIRWADRQILVLDTVSPPCPMLTPSSSNICAALHSHPLLVEHAEAVKALRTCGTVAIHVNEYDGAAGNDKLHACLSRDPKFKEPSTMYDYVLCCNHQQHLVSLSVLSVMGLKITNDTLLGSYFLSFNGHWSRLLACVRHVVDGKLKVSYEDPPVGVEEYKIEFVQFCLRNERADFDEGSEDTAQRRRAQHQLFEDLTEFIAVFNGAWWLSEWVHHCKRDGSCCGKLGDSDQVRLEISRSRAAKSSKAVLFRRRPGKASSNKWSKVWPVFYYFWLGSMPHNMLRVFCENALKNIRMEYEKAFDEETRKNQLNSDGSEELSYHAVNGMRVRRLFKLLASGNGEATIQRFFTLCDEPGRVLSFYFQRASEGGLRNGRPFLLDMASRSTSPVVASLQYLSGMVNGCPPACRLAWQMTGHSSMGEWVAACPGDASLFRRTLLGEISKTKRRHSHFQEPPFALTALEDSTKTTP